MAKRIIRSEPIYIAPEILGFYEGNTPKAFDERKLRQLNPNDTDDKIYIYERQVNEWFLNKASRFLKSNGNGFIVLMICLSYLEGVEQYKQGISSIRRSGEFFRNSIHKLYPNTFSDNDLTQLYEEARCGLFHNGMVSGKIIIDNTYSNAIEFPDLDTIRISPEKLLFDIKNDFKCYVSELRDKKNTSIRNNFNYMFSNV